MASKSRGRSSAKRAISVALLWLSPLHSRYNSNSSAPKVTVDAPIKPTVLGHGAQGLATAEGANEDADAEGLPGFAACSSFFICMCCCCCFVCMAPGVGILIWLLVAWGMHMDDDCDQPLQMWVVILSMAVMPWRASAGRNHTPKPQQTKRSLTSSFPQSLRSYHLSTK